ncbi:tubulointerstitial nephritis antigen-like 1 [Anaeramoeba ignava]|uniref:Tubulointerstitial nephritis antigen-like 1 n=1 Tax=Anaeramoeba ignava TaxID=1746090 RepID=A0A9Q0LRD2_ANAIG|nr:tubulointerstitial nephritis antigen-like 1 [Anaeramoeba ignava]
MKLSLLIFLFLIITVFSGRYEELVNQINAANAGWISKENLEFSKKTDEDLKRLFNLKIDPPENFEKTKIRREKLTDPPANFDAREAWPGCIGGISDEGKCGSSWAIPAVEALSDRLCIESNSTIKVRLSPQFLVDCDSYNFGCNGGWLYAAWQFLTSNGSVSIDCYPYTSGGSGEPGLCRNTCTNGSDFSFYFANDFYGVWEVYWIMTEIYLRGSIQSAFTIFEDFLHYSSGIYSHVAGNEIGGHSLRIIGWGVDNGVDYWICANSWGTSWGINGYANILKGFNECGIETTIVTGHPKVAN